MKRLIIISILVGWCSLVCADGLSSLTLTDGEMQKLKKFFPSDDNSNLVWSGDPIKIQLTLGKEKRLVFPGRVNVDVKGTLNTDQLKLVNNDKSLYLTGLISFPETRIYVTLQESGEVILIDLVTGDAQTSSTQYIELKKNKLTVTTSHASLMETELGSESFVDMIRFAWRQVYAPDYLLNESVHYPRAPMKTDQLISDLIYGDKVIAHPEGSWMIGQSYITVVYLQNKYSHSTHIDLQSDICGSWQVASLYPRFTLKPHGMKEGDSTTLFLISNRPFGEVMQVCYGNA